MLGAVAVLTAIIVIYGGYAEGAKQVATALAALASDAFEGGRTATSRSRLRRDARALRPRRDRGLDPADAERQSLRGLALDPAVASAARGPGRICRPRCACPGRSASRWSPVRPARTLLPPPASRYFSIGVGGLGAAFVLQGLAVAHALSRGLKMRPVMLIALYACCVLRAKYTLPVLAALSGCRRLPEAARAFGFPPCPKPNSAHR